MSSRRGDRGGRLNLARVTGTEDGYLIIMARHVNTDARRGLVRVLTPQSILLEMIKNKTRVGEWHPYS